jgi:serine/alanine adding enzyme
MRIRLSEQGEEHYWDQYVYRHPRATLCHLYGWGKVIRKTYGHPSYYLVAEDHEEGKGRAITGILPLVHIKSLLFGNSLVSMPFLNYGGLLADDEEMEKTLFEEARRLGRELKVKNIELRHVNPISWTNGQGAEASQDLKIPKPMTHKVRMLLDLPESSEKLFESFKSKLRSQIRKPQKEGLVSIIGGEELLHEYYHVFSINMRDLGSPVHSKKLFETILKEFGGRVRLGVVKYKGVATAAGLIFCFRDLIEIIWASSLKSFNHLSPNMLLYWSFLQYAMDGGYKQFDFGRSTPDEGTYKFKEQWGAKPSILYWYENGLNLKTGRSVHETTFRLRLKGEELWQGVPIFVANAVGPLIRKNIPL